MGKSVALFNDGTIINPPPTPSNPEKNPAKAPAAASDLAQGAVQINLPIDWLSKHGGGRFSFFEIPRLSLYAAINILIETKTRSSAKPITIGLLGMSFANHIPTGARIRPKTAIKEAAR